MSEPSDGQSASAGAPLPRRLIGSELADENGGRSSADVRAMRIVSIDSAEISGIAVIDRDDAGRLRLVHHDVIGVYTSADVERAASAIAQQAPDVCAVEEPFVHPRNPSTGLVLARLLGRWLQALEARGLACATIPASMWQTRVLPGVSQRTRSAERKAAAITFARERFGVVVGEDAADAIALGSYVAMTASRKAT